MEILIGAIVSLVVELIKKLTGTKDWLAVALTIAVSFIAAVIYAVLVSAGIWDKIIPILINAAGIYALIIKRFEN